MTTYKQDNTGIVKHASYTLAEAAVAHAEIAAMVEAGTITSRSAAAYKAHVSRRIADGRKPLPPIVSDQVEKTFRDNEDTHFITARDGRCRGKYVFDLTETEIEFDLYRNSHVNDGVANLFADDAERTPEFVNFLSNLKGRYQIDFIICLEDCISGRWFEIDRASFDHEDDAVLFRLKVMGEQS